MFSPKTITAILAAALLPALTTASTASLEDRGIPGACTGSVCCTPSCAVVMGDFHGCNAIVPFAGSCFERTNNNEATIDAAGCDDVQVTMLIDEQGQKVFDLYHKPSKTYDRYLIEECERANYGGRPCVPSGGGCGTRQILTGAISPD